MNGQVRYVYYHQKDCHPGKKKLGDLHKHIIGINHLLKGNVFFDCASYHAGMASRRKEKLAERNGDNSITPITKLGIFSRCIHLKHCILMSSRKYLTTSIQ